MLLCLVGSLPPWGVLRGGNPALSLGLPFVSFICGTVAALCLLVACLSRRWGAWGCGLWALGLAWLRLGFLFFCCEMCASPLWHGLLGSYGRGCYLLSCPSQPTLHPFLT